MPEEERPVAEELKEEEELGLRPVESSMVSEVGYEEEELQVVFANGAEHSYPISKQQFEDLLAAPSIGKWLWENVDLARASGE